MREREINLVNLVVEILLRWRTIVAAMVIGAVCLGGLSYAQSYRTFKAQDAKVKAAKLQLEQEMKEAEEAVQAQREEQEDLAQISKKWLEERLTETQLQNIRYVLAYEKLYDEKVAYQEQSILMQIDPNNVKKADLTFFIQSDDITRTYSLERVYEELLSSGELFDNLAKQLNISSTNASEMISLEKKDDGYAEGTDTLRVKVVHFDEGVCKEAVSVLVNFINAKHDELSEVLGQHKMIVLNQSLTVVSDTNIMNCQNEYLNDIVALKEKINNMKTKFANTEWQYYDIMINGKITDLSISKVLTNTTDSTQKNEKAETGESLTDIISKGVTVQPGVSAKYVFLGLFFGAFVYVFTIFVRYVINTKIRVTDNLQNIYRIPQFGLISQFKKSDRFLGAVDDWILGLRDRNKRKFTEEEAVRFAAVAVKMAAGKESVSSVYMVGCDLKERVLAVCEQLKTVLSEENIHVEILSNVLYDAQTMGELEKAESVVLVESAGTTFYDEIAQELELLNRQGIKVLGGIIVE